MIRTMSVSLVSVCAFLTASHAHATDWFVPSDASEIQTVIDTMASSGDTIYVSPGTYGKIDFNNLNLRIIATSGPALTTIDASATGGSAVIVDGAQSFSATTLDGFTITGGTGGIGARGGATGNGGGVYISNAGVTVQNCVITGNEADNGGAVFASGSFLSYFINCEISNNAATDISTGFGGGRLHPRRVGLGVQLHSRR